MKINQWNMTDESSGEARLSTTEACSYCLVYTSPSRSGGPLGAPRALKRSGYHGSGPEQVLGWSGHWYAPCDPLYHASYCCHTLLSATVRNEARAIGSGGGGEVGVGYSS